METYSAAETTRRTGLDAAGLTRLVELGILTPDEHERFTTGDVRRAGLVKSLVAAGISLDGLGAAMRSGTVSLDFLDAAAFERFSAMSGDTFASLAERLGVSVELLLFIREASGSATPLPDHAVRDEELPPAQLIATAIEAGIRPGSIQQMIRTQGDSMRRVAETEAAMWQAEIIGPATQAGVRADEVLGNDAGDRMSAATERALIAMYHLQQTKAWTGNIIEGLETMLAAAGLHSRLEHPPAMCFLDLTGYTSLTQEHGDLAAADLAERLGRVVQRESIKGGGRAVKWLGDGVMLHFPNPALGVVAALDMVDGVASGGLPPAHVGLHAGPVIFQEGDYYGQTVNLASRIADFARPGEVIVSQAVVDASDGAPVVFRDVGPVELKGVTGSMRLHAASRPA